MTVCVCVSVCLCDCGGASYYHAITYECGQIFVLCVVAVAIKLIL